MEPVVEAERFALELLVLGVVAATLPEARWLELSVEPVEPVAEAERSALELVLGLVAAELPVEPVAPVALLLLRVLEAPVALELDWLASSRPVGVRVCELELSLRLMKARASSEDCPTTAVSTMLSTEPIRSPLLS